MKSRVFLTIATSALLPVLAAAKVAPKTDASIAAVRSTWTRSQPRLATLRTNGEVVREARLPARTGNAVISPDGRRVAYVVYLGQRRLPGGADAEKTDIWVARTDGTHTARLTGTHDARDPVWSPDGKTIVFTRHTDTIVHMQAVGGTLLRVASIWLVGSTSGYLTELPTQTPEGHADTASAWAPDGSALTLTRCGPATYGLDPTGKGHGASFVDIECDVVNTRLDGSHQTTLVTSAEEPTWSPNGRSIAFTSNRGHSGTVRAGEDEDQWSRDIYVKDIATGAERQLTKTPGDSEVGPRWSSDGRRLLFVRSGHDPDQISEINPDGTCRQAVTNESKGAYAAAQWLPTARPGRLRCG